MLTNSYELGRVLAFHVMMPFLYVNVNIIAYALVSCYKAVTHKWLEDGFSTIMEHDKSLFMLYQKCLEHLGKQIWQGGALIFVLKENFK